MLELLKSIDAFAWGPPLLILLVGTGIYLTIRLGLLQVLRLPKAFQLIFIQDKGHGMYPVLQLCVQPWHQLLEQEIS